MNFKPVIDYIENVLCKEKGVPGCDLKIMREHETVLRHSCGFSDYEKKTPVSEKDLYFLYSCTKPMTCTAAMQLFERGELNLDAPVSDYLPEYENVFLIKDGKKVVPKKTMTVRHLFTMSAGLDYDIDKKPIQDVLLENPQATTLDIVNAFVKSPLDFEPGEKFQYSLCHDVLAAVVESVSGVNFSEYMKENIWSPLGMTDIGFHLSDEDKKRLAAQYIAESQNDVKSAEMKNRFYITPNYESGGAGLYSDVESYSLFADALANGGIGTNGNRIIKSETIDLMRSEQLSKYLMDTRFGCAAGQGYGYGLGVRTLTDKSGGQRSALGEFGWDGAAGSYVMIDPENKLSIFFAMHVLSWPNLIGCGHAPIRDLTYEALGL